MSFILLTSLPLSGWLPDANTATRQHKEDLGGLRSQISTSFKGRRGLGGTCRMALPRQNMNVGSQF